VDGDGVHEQFRDLDPETKARVIQQINRRYQGKTVLT
jgi:ABC-type transport system involved in cytochrome bd biosynthesis fused ATPase/permease subunit